MGRFSAIRGVILGLAAVAMVAGSALPATAATGPDVASYQHPGSTPIDWYRVRAAGHTFAFIKATEDTGYTNPWFRRDWDGAGAAGLYRGAYHYAKPQYPLTSAVLQARYYVSAVGSLRDANALPPTLDLEETGGLSPGDLIAWTQAWLTEVQNLTGRVPMIYSGPGFWSSAMANTRQFSAYYLWIASWTSAASPPTYPAGWGTYTFWQFTSSASIPGISGNVDLNRYCCSDSALAALAHGSTGGSAGSDPFGSLDGAGAAPGAINVAGWAIDPDTTASLGIHIYIDGTFQRAVTANQSRSDVAAAYPGFGAAHGFNTTIPVGPGRHFVCAYALNQGAGDGNSTLGCSWVTLGGNPFGSFDGVGPGYGGLRLTGWTLDPDTTGPVPVHVYVDGRFNMAGSANASRPDVGAAFGGFGPNHGFDLIADVGDGAHTVCVYGINAGIGTGNPLIGCRSYTVRGAVYGSFDGAVGVPGGVRVSGWAIDPDVGGAVPVHVYVDATGYAISANTSRPDVGIAYPSAGSGHGFDAVVASGPGAHQVCTYAIDQGSGLGNKLLGCRTVTV